MATLRGLTEPMVALLLLVGAVAPANACGFDGVMSGNFSAIHPKSIAVAIALRKSIDAGVLDRSAADPIVPGSSGYWRAVGRLNKLTRILSSSATDNREKPSAISVLLIDSNLWARLTASRHGFELQAHTAGAASGDATIVTSEAVLAAALERKVTIDDLLKHGLIVLDGEAAAISKLGVLLSDGLTGLPSATESARSAPLRFFGSAR